jgi:hypothetical protein
MSGTINCECGGKYDKKHKSSHFATVVHTEFFKDKPNAKTVDEKYQQGKIYKIVSPNNEMSYVGSTINTLNDRLSQHKYDYACCIKGTCRFVTSFGIFEKFGVDNCKIELIETFPCNSRLELEKREGEIIQVAKLAQSEIVNQLIAGRTNLEYGRTVGSEKHLCECGGYYDINHKGRHMKTKKHLQNLA